MDLAIVGVILKLFLLRDDEKCVWALLNRFIRDNKQKTFIRFLGGDKENGDI